MIVKHKAMNGKTIHKIETGKDRTWIEVEVQGGRFRLSENGGVLLVMGVAEPGEIIGNMYLEMQGGNSLKIGMFDE